MKKRIIAFAAVAALLPISLSASDVLPQIVKNIAEGAEVGQASVVAKNEAVTFSLGTMNAELDKVEDRLLSTSNFTHLELSLGSDVFGLNSGNSTKSELMSVYRLKETKNLFLFNQTSLVNFDKRTTVNVGLGARNINDDETMIVGLNGFYDYELDSKHGRTGLGVEFLTSMFELRANTYNAVTGSKTYNGSDETALNGNDIKFTANLPYLYASNVYYSQAEWTDDATYKTETKEWGVSAEVVPNWVINVAQQKKDSSKEETVASISFSIPLGRAAQPTKVKQDGVWSTKLNAIREKLYQPVQRENRIMKKTVTLGVTFAGY